MQDKISLNQVRAFGEIIEDSIQFFKQNIKPLLRSYVTICGFFWATSLIVSLFNQVQTSQRLAEGGSYFSITWFFATCFEMLSFLMITLTVNCYMALYKEKQNQAPTVEEVWVYVKYYFFRVLGSYIALGALIAAATLCCLLPGIYFMVVLSLTIPIMVMENATLGYAFSRSFQLIKQNWWYTLGVIIVTEIILFAAMLSVGIPAALVLWGVTFLTNANGTDVYNYALVIITHLLQFVYILPLIAVVLAYFSFTEEKDYGALLNRIMMLGKNNDPAAEQTTEEY